MDAVTEEQIGYSRREQRGWYMYDWANSAFYTTVVALFLGPWLTTLAQAAADSAGFVYPLGIKVGARSVWPYTVSLAVFLQVLILPLMGAIADYGRRKRELLGLFAYLGAFATVLMYTLTGDRYLLGCALFLVANTAFGASVVIYNAFLPEISSAQERDGVSSKGWGIGYIGGGLLLALNLLLYAKAKSVGITEEQAIRVSLCSAGLWWAVFTVIPMMTLHNRGPQKQLPRGETYFAAGLKQLGHTLKDVRHYPQTLLFLLAYLCYNDAIQTVITLASSFGEQELHLPMSSLTSMLLMVQFVAFFGAILFNYVAKLMGTKRAVMTSLVIWTGILVYVYLAVNSELQFFIMGALVAIVLGGSQALSRSLYSFMIPKGQEAEYFSLYEVSDKGTSWLGPLVFGLALQYTNSYRVAILSLVVFFVAGLLLLWPVNVHKASIEARRGEV